jgi:hypothetical protein
MLTESSDAICFRKSLQILAIASLSSPHFDANPFSALRGNVPGLRWLTGAPYRWRRACGYGNLPPFESNLSGGTYRP